MQHDPVLALNNLSIAIQEKEILHNIKLELKKGEVHAIMGPNGSGKSTLAMSLMGHPGYNIQLSREAGSRFAGQISNFQFKINGIDVNDLTPEERAKEGLFVSFQSPVEITGVSLLAFLRTAYKELHPDKKMILSEFKVLVKEALDEVGLSESFMHRSVNEGFSGGERKRCEIVQMLVLKPKIAILDEIDSGLDIDSLKLVAQAVSNAVKKQKLSVLMITHYQRILHFVKPDKVHVLINGNIQKSGKMSLVRRIEKEGYAPFSV